jgi:hypothetical protein
MRGTKESKTSGKIGIDRLKEIIREEMSAHTNLGMRCSTCGHSKERHSHSQRMARGYDWVMGDCRGVDKLCDCKRFTTIPSNADPTLESVVTEAVDHASIRDVVNVASKLLAAVEMFKEKASPHAINAVTPHIGTLEKVLEDMVSTPGSYVQKPKVEPKKVSLRAVKGEGAQKKTVSEGLKGGLPKGEVYDLIWDVTVGSGDYQISWDKVVAKVEARLKRKLTHTEKYYGLTKYDQCMQEMNENPPVIEASVPQKKSIDLVYSDVGYGTKEFGMFPRKPGQDPDAEDIAYQNHVQKVTSDKSWRCADGKLFKRITPSPQFEAVNEATGGDGKLERVSEENYQHLEVGNTYMCKVGRERVKATFDGWVDEAGNPTESEDVNVVKLQFTDVVDPLTWQAYWFEKSFVAGSSAETLYVKETF